MMAVEQRKREVSDAIDQFSEAKVKADELFFILKNVDPYIDYWGVIELRAWFLQVRQSVRETNQAVLRLLWSAPESSISISNFADPGFYLD